METKQDRGLGDALLSIDPKTAAVLIAIAWIVLHSKSEAFRKAERRILKRILTAVWEDLTDLWAYLAGGSLRPTREERRIMRRLSPKHWEEHAGIRGLAGTLTGRPRLTRAGIVVAVRLDGTWSVKKLQSSEENIGALLGTRTALRMSIGPGKRRGWAELAVRTRSAADGTLVWKPGDAFGVDTVTGQDVHVALGQRMLVAGRSGSGKSWAMRPMLHAASEGPTNALVVIDLKQVEARLWEHRARVATTPEEVMAVVEELVAEMNERLEMIPRGQDTLKPSKERPRITVFVDEGAEVMSRVKEALDGLESIARMGRSPIIDIWWGTQKPTMSGSSAGIPAQIAPQLTTVICLSVRTPTEARTVLGEDAQTGGWNAHELPSPGYALLRTDDPDDKPHPVRTRALSPKDVIALPPSRIWSRSGGCPVSVPSVSGPRVPSVRPVSGSGAPAVQSVSESAEGIPEDLLSAVWGLSEEDRTLSVHDKVLSALVSEGGPVGARQVADLSGVAPSSAHRALRALVDDGRVVQDDDKKYRASGPAESMV